MQKCTVQMQALKNKWDKWDFAGFEFQKSSVYAAYRVRVSCPPPKNQRPFQVSFLFNRKYQSELGNKKYP